METRLGLHRMPNHIFMYVCCIRTNFHVRESFMIFANEPRTVKFSTHENLDVHALVRMCSPSWISFAKILVWALLIGFCEISAVWKFVCIRYIHICTTMCQSNSLVPVAMTSFMKSPLCLLNTSPAWPEQKPRSGTLLVGYTRLSSKTEHSVMCAWG